jgi:hypothetical protein
MVQSSANYSMSNLPPPHKFRRDACRMIFKILEGCDRAGKLKFLRRGNLRSAASRNVDGTVALHLPHGICSGLDVFDASDVRDEVPTAVPCAS